MRRWSGQKIGFSDEGASTVAGAQAASPVTSHAPAFNTRYKVSNVFDETEETGVPELTLDVHERHKSMVALCCNGCCWRTDETDHGVSAGNASTNMHPAVLDVFEQLTAHAVLKLERIILASGVLKWRSRSRSCESAERSISARGVFECLVAYTQVRNFVEEIYFSIQQCQWWTTLVRLCSMTVNA